MPVPIYPEFAPLTLEMRDELYPALNMCRDGVSEFTFSNLYLFRLAYVNLVSHVPGSTFLISGVRKGERYYYAPCNVPQKEIMDELFKTHDYQKNMPESHAEAHRVRLEAEGRRVMEDRDNFDYLYNREDLATLNGRDFHKKRNLVNAFLNSYSYEQRTLDSSTLSDAKTVLDLWREQKGIEGDYKGSMEALDTYELLGMRGCVYYIDGKPVAWVLGEPIAKARMFAIHFEKAVDGYKGLYQFINQAFVKSLPSYFKLINREQDLGDPGLRQAKMTYRPCGFVKKYRVYPS